MINFEYTLQAQFSNEKMSTFLTIMHVLLNRMLLEKMEQEQGLELFKDLFMKHAIQRPPYSIEVFS